MKKTLALILALVMLISISTTAIYAEDFAISDELLEAVRVDYAGLDNIEKSDIHLYYNLHINGDKYLVRLEVSGCAYPDDVVFTTETYRDWDGTKNNVSLKVRLRHQMNLMQATFDFAWDRI